MASSSLAIDSYDQYDVFLSFRGEDTRYNFTSHLYDALRRNSVKAFIDYSIDRGDEITPALERVIDGAKICIVVFSEKYADSTFCLEELVRIMECKESNAQIVLPIFYKVDPSEETYKEAFARHETNTKDKKRRRGETIKQGMKKVERWKSAFLQSLELAGWHVDEKSDETEIIAKIIKTLSEKLNNILPKGEELMSTSMVGQTAEDNFKRIWECLMNDKISRVGVYGMGGVGKTTIATRINDQLLASVNIFSCVCWVTVSKDLSICNMQNNIATMINLDLSKEHDERKRAAKLRKRLKSEKFVLILDDVWEVFQIEDVGIPPLADGQKLLLTSRSLRVCEIMECQSIELKPLSKQEALDLFVKESKCQINDSVEWRDIACSIVKECDGLPLAIVVIARKMIRVREIWNWRNTLRELQKPYEGENLEMENKVFKVLKFSYDCLPNDKCRQCFLYCSLFPEDHIFKRGDLIDYWIGMGIIDELDSRQAELDKGNTILDELIHSSLIEKSSRRMKMHDVIRDMARIIVKVGLQFQDPLESVQVLYGRMINSFHDSTPQCSKLKTLVLCGYGIAEISGSFFGNMQSLNVFHVTNVESLPYSINYLGNLKVLIITRCHNLRCIPPVVGLKRLRHLKISDNKRLEKIPKGIKRLVDLRVLDVSDNWSLRGSFPNSVIEKLSHLQNLNLGPKIKVEPEAIISLEKLEMVKVTFYNLQKLNFYVKSGHWQRLQDYQIDYGTFDREEQKKGMCLDVIRDAEEWKGESVIFLTDDIQYLKLVGWKSPMFNVLKNPPFANLRAISFTKYHDRYLFTVDLAQQFLHNIQQLSLYDCDGLKEIIATEEEWVSQSNCINYPTIRLPNLKMLSLKYLFQLRSIYRGRMDCPSLELIKNVFCDQLERLPFCMEKEGNKPYPSIKLGGVTYISRNWWDSLQWDDPNDKTKYHLIFCPDSEHEPEYEGETEVDTEYESESETEVDTEYESETS